MLSAHEETYYCISEVLTELCKQRICIETTQCYHVQNKIICKDIQVTACAADVFYCMADPCIYLSCGPEQTSQAEVKGLFFFFLMRKNFFFSFMRPVQFLK